MCNLLTSIFLALSMSLLSLSVNAQTESAKSEFETLLSRLNVQEIASTNQIDNSLLGAEQLLTYFKKRKHVMHPASIGKGPSKVSDRDKKWASDALEHIFVGQPALPSFFCGDDIDWDLSPVSDMEWKWQLHRMYFWNAMGKVYASSKDETYAEAWCDQLVDWTKKNLHNLEHKDAWRSIEAGVRGRNWTTLFYRFLHSKHFNDEVLIAFLNSCYDHAEYLMTAYSAGSNWALIEAEGLAFIAFTFPEFKNAAGWKDEAIRRFNIEIDNQVNADGYQQELTMNYHIGSINWFMRSYELAQINGEGSAFPETFVDKIERMCEVPMKVCLPDGTSPQFGDDWAGKPHQFASRFKGWSERFDRDDFLYFASKGTEGEAPEETAYMLDESGIYSFRSGWEEDAICMVMKCGPDGGSHCQPDNGTFTLFAGGKNLMPDAGSYVYSGDPEGRSWFRQSKVHQTLTLDGMNSAFHPSLVKWETSDSLDMVIVENQSYPDLKHRRSIFFIDKKYFVIVDDAIGKASGVVDIHFQLAQGNARFDSENLEIHSLNKQEWNVGVHTMSDSEVRLEEEEGWVSFDYSKKEQRPAFKFSIDKKRDEKKVRFVSLIVPYEQEIPKLALDFDFSEEENIEFQLSIDGEIKSYKILLK
ncbi:alginate lyase family protein [Portibacter lacus]|nr:alginate lyase family protein [Portibacter lacus]